MRMARILLTSGTIITGSHSFTGDVLIEDGIISEVSGSISTSAETTLDLTGKYLLPGMIDTHVHFREPGLTHKGDITTETQAAIAGGVTTVCDMPNTIPQVLTYDILKQKQQLYAQKSYCNFGIYMGTGKDNLEELKKADSDPSIPAFKIFMAESTGDMTLAEDRYLEPIFAETNKLIAVHAEDEQRILDRKAAFAAGTLEGAEDLDPSDPLQHALIRDNMAAALGTKHAVELALKHQHQTHILHMSSAEELEYLQRGKDTGLVTGETCPHYLLFSRDEISKHGGYRIMNPALKQQKDVDAMWQAIQSGLIDHYATDHAPHLRAEKDLPYGQLPAGLPAVQFALPLLLHWAAEGKLTLQQVVSLYAEMPARHYGINRKGHIAVGMDADITIVNPNTSFTIADDQVLSKCKWSPFSGMMLTGGAVETTLVNGEIVYQNGTFVSGPGGKTITVSR